MATLFTYVRSNATDLPYFAVVADDSGARYVWPQGAESWFPSDDASDRLLPDEEPPSDAQGWLELATRNLGPEIDVDPPFDDATSPAQAARMASSYMSEVVPLGAPPVGNPDLIGAPDAFDQVAQDYPGFGDDDETLGDYPGAMENLVLMALGPIDPEGPNGWILRAMDGNPRPGDEDEYVHFPGTIDASADETDR